MENENLPKTLLEAVRFFTDLDICTQFMASVRWPDGITCPHCDQNDQNRFAFLAKRRIWQCKACRKQFSVKTGSVMEDSPIGLDKWLPAIWMIVNAKNGVSSYEIHRALGITQKSAWFLLHRIRLAMQSKTWNKLSGHVEVDETFIGGKARFMHKSVIAKKYGGEANKGSSSVGKVAVMGLLERHGEVRAQVIYTNSREILHSSIQENVEQGTNVYTDGWKAYRGLDEQFIHGVIDHAEKYVDGNVHTNSIENFWSLLKRCIKGTYVSVEPFHLFRYLDEQCFRYNKRMGNDLYRFLEVAKSLTGKRLEYKQLIGEPSS